MIITVSIEIVATSSDSLEMDYTGAILTSLIFVTVLVKLHGVKSIDSEDLMDCRKHIKRLVRVCENEFERILITPLNI